MYEDDCGMKKTFPAKTTLTYSPSASTIIMADYSSALTSDVAGCSINSIELKAAGCSGVYSGNLVVNGV